MHSNIKQDYGGTTTPGIFIKQNHYVLKMDPEPERRTSSNYWFKSSTLGWGTNVKIEYEHPQQKSTSEVIIIVFSSLIGIGASATFQAIISLLSKSSIK